MNINLSFIVFTVIIFLLTLFEFIFLSSSALNRLVLFWLVNLLIKNRKMQVGLNLGNSYVTITSKRATDILCLSTNNIIASFFFTDTKRKNLLLLLQKPHNIEYYSNVNYSIGLLLFVCL